MAVAVVAGGSAGLGRAVVRELADDGWDVAVLARGEERLAATSAIAAGVAAVTIVGALAGARRRR